MDKFVIMFEWFDSFDHLKDDEKGIIFQNFYNYHTGNPVDLSNRVVAVAWKLILPNINRMNDKYEKNIANGKLGGAPKGRIPWNKKPIANQEHTESIPNAYQEHNYKEKEIEIEKEIEESKVKENIDLDSYLDSLITNKEKFIMQTRKPKIKEPIVPKIKIYDDLIVEQKKQEQDTFDVIGDFVKTLLPENEL